MNENQRHTDIALVVYFVILTAGITACGVLGIANAWVS